MYLRAALVTRTIVLTTFEIDNFKTLGTKLTTRANFEGLNCILTTK